MPHRVFISYASQDGRPADAVCAALEGNGIRCWISHRDNTVGASWSEMILAAINEARVVVLVLSGHSNRSSMVAREIERAASKNIPIVALRIEDVKPSKSLEFFLSANHWFDAYPLPVEHYADALLAAVRPLLRKRAGKDGANLYPYMVARGPAAHRAFTGEPEGPWDATIRGSESIDDLRTKLLHKPIELPKPVEIKVRGTLFPCALLSSGWWEKQKSAKVQHLKWRDGLQEWLFTGFDQWGPSWDFTWDFDNWAKSRQHRHFIAQLGDGDEANSIPVLLPPSKAMRLQDVFKSRWGGTQAEISGVLGHRKHFAKYVDSEALALFGGLLDYCLWLDEDNKKHVISVRAENTESYSGYLWKCVAPKALLHSSSACLNDVYFIWEHTNFANRDAISYCLEAMQHKEDYIRRQYGDLVLVQKSSSLVDGTPALEAESVYGMLLGKTGEEI
jgi:hypothetical protein